MKKDFGFTIVSPEKKENGFKSPDNEDKYIKKLILSDLKNNFFDIAIIVTGDDNNKDVISFPAIAKEIQKNKKQVLFSFFNLTTSKKIKENFEFHELSLYPMFPRGNNPEIVGLNL